MRSDIKEMKVSAIQLAELSGLRTEDIHYWARRGFITRKLNGSKRPFAISDLPKVQLMGKLTKSYDLDAGKASRLADDLLKMHATKPDAYAAALALLEAFDKNLTTLASVLTKLGFVDAMKKSGLVDMGEAGGAPAGTVPCRAKKKAKAP